MSITRSTRQSIVSSSTNSNRRRTNRLYQAAIIESLEARQLLTTLYPGDLDPTFHTTGYVVTDVPGAQEQVSSMVIQADGKIVAAGQCGEGDFFVTRYNVDGSLDDGSAADSTPGDSFGATGTVITDFDNASYDYPTSLVIQPNGKIIAVGVANGNLAMIRYNSDGAPDSTFGVNGKFYQPDSALPLASAATIKDNYLYVAATAGAIVAMRFSLADGALDSTYGTAGQATVDAGNWPVISDIAIQSDGKLVIGGYTGTNDGGIAFLLARLTATGQPDSVFATNGLSLHEIGSDAQIRKIHLESNGKIVAVGENSTGLLVARYTAAGQLDATFGTGGSVEGTFGNSGSVNSAAFQSDGKIVAIGASDDNFCVARYNSNGTPDTSGITAFGAGAQGYSTTTLGERGGYAQAVVIQTDGRIVLGGYSESNTAVARFLGTQQTIDLEAPTVSAHAANIISGGAPTYDFTVTYTDDVAVSVSTIGAGDVVVTGPDGSNFSQTATWVSNNLAGDGTPRTATYRITPPGGSWDIGDNGGYTITLQPQQVSDTSGNWIDQTPLGGFTVAIPPVDHIAPTASLLAAPNITTTGGTTYTITVDYADNNAIDPATIRAANIVVKNAHNVALPVTAATGSAQPDGHMRAVYTITPPGGSWDIADNGGYTISLPAGQVKDPSGNPVAANPSLGTFQVSIAPPHTTAPTATTAAATVIAAGGKLYIFKVTYTDSAKVKASRLGTGDVEVISPANIHQIGKFVSKTTNADSNSITVTYSIVPPGKKWAKTGNGTYNIFTRANEVSDIFNNYMLAKKIGSFVVKIK